MDQIEEDYKEKKDLPSFLIVLAVLSLLSIASSLFNGFVSLSGEPLTVEQAELSMADFNEQIEEMEEMEGGESVVNFIVGVTDHIMYTLTDAYYSSVWLNLIAAIIGAIGVVLMLKLKKIGFHIYVVYSLLPILGLYLIMPFDIISTFLVVASLFISALFVVLYGLNLKYMK